MTGFFVGALAVTALYCALTAWGWRRTRRDVAALSPPEDVPSDPLPLSVIVAARNEETALPRLLRRLLGQIRDGDELLIVDDGSTDATASIARRWCASHETIRLIRRPAAAASGSKKAALSRGIAAASNDVLAFTDADCLPAPTWLDRMRALHAETDDEAVVTGYSPMRTPEDATPLVGPFARYETLIAGIYTAAAAGLRRPYMGVGRNLSYPRSVFEAVNGFDAHAETLSGDDDLFVQSVHRRGAARVLAPTDPETFVETQGPTTWSAWIQRKRRHVSTGRHYPWTVGLHLTLFHGSFALLWLAPLAIGTTGLGLLATGLLARHAALAPAADALDEDDLLAAFPLWELGYLFYLLILAPLGLLSEPEEWR
jgi:cellulose synthase/poly-beta-1,6-N-acetylglucosamine synthase-like glycosyltransferase